MLLELGSRSCGTAQESVEKSERNGKVASLYGGCAGPLASECSAKLRATLTCANSITLPKV